MADHIRAELSVVLVIDALRMAIWNRRLPAGTIHHSDHRLAVDTAWLFGYRLREAGLTGSMGSIGDCFDNNAIDSLYANLQTELLDR